MALAKDEFQFTEEEEIRVKEFGKELATKTAYSAVFHPLAFTKVLFQLGHEPYALSEGKSMYFFGRHAYFLPNVIQYIRNIIRDQGFATLFTGIDAAIATVVVHSGVSFTASLYIDRFYPEIGGVPIADKPEHEISDHYSARLIVRKSIRNSITTVVGTIVSRPFAVIMIRKIAQNISNEIKYPNFFCSFMKIGKEEGPAGLFSGLLPAIIADLVIVWGGTAIRYGIERCLQRTGIDDIEDEDAKERAKEGRFMLDFLVPFIANSFAYPFQVVSTVMALTGSNLAVSLLPYSPAFTTWFDAYDYLKVNHAFVRGSRLFVREYKETISIGKDGHMYARSAHFI